MAQSNFFWKVFNFFLPFSDFMYILQQEEYSSRRLVRWLPRFFFRRNFRVRDKLKYTKRVRLTLSFVILLWSLSLVLLILILPNVQSRIIALIAWLVLIPLFVLLGNAFIFPYFENIKSGIRKKAATKVAAMPNLKVIAVAGGYGKTTVKNFIQQLVQYNYRTQMVSGNINTPSGIADWVNKNLETNTEILIAEVDAYEIGEIARSCLVIPADIAVLTNIGDQHLERFGSESTLAKALSEVFSFSKSTGKLVTSEEANAKLPTIEFKQRELVLVNLSESPEYKDEKVEMSNLSESNKTNLKFALQVADILSIPAKFIIDTVKKLELPDRRQRLTEMYGYQAIDDSYNISFTTAQAGLAAARVEADKLGKKLLVMTAGIPELAPDKKDNNRKLGEVLSKQADHIVVLGSMFADEVARGIGDKNKHTVVANLNTFLNETRGQFPSGEWFLLMQPELGDLYY